jgi:hypothetical protein
MVEEGDMKAESANGVEHDPDVESCQMEKDEGGPLQAVEETPGQ